MPRKPSPKNLENPLRILRVLCSEYGEVAPLTQVRLAQITGIAPDYIRSLENSRRPLNKSQLDKIRYSIGAVWDLKHKMWHPNGLPDEPYSYEWFTRYQTLWVGSKYQQDIETHMLCRRLQALLQGVETTDYNLVFDRIYHALEEIRTELKVGAAKSVFDKTAFEIQHDRNPKTGEIRSIRRTFKLEDKEIVRKDLETGVGDEGYLDLTPYSFCVTRYGNVQTTINIEVSGSPPKETYTVKEVTVPERYNKLAAKLRAERDNA